MYSKTPCKFLDYLHLQKHLKLDIRYSGRNSQLFDALLQIDWQVRILVKFQEKEIFAQLGICGNRTLTRTSRRQHSTAVNCYWLSLAQLFLASGPGSTHDQFFVHSKTIYMFPLRLEEGLVFPSRCNIFCTCLLALTPRLRLWFMHIIHTLSLYYNK